MGYKEGHWVLWPRGLFTGAFVDDTLVACCSYWSSDADLANVSIGEQERALITFIMEQLKKHCQPQELLKSLEDVLANDAELFVKKLWRALIYHMISEEKAGVE
jgi:hypothetical protein